MRQMRLLTARNMEIIWNNKRKILFTIGLPVISSLCIGLVIKKDLFDVYEATKSGMFCIVCAIIFIGLFNTIQEICNERAILKREYMKGLSLGAYVFAKMITQFIMCAIQTILFSGVLALVVKLPKKGLVTGNFFVDMVISLFLLAYASAGMGLLVSSLVKNGDLANVIAPIILIFQIVFSGVLFKLEGAGNTFASLMVSKWGMEAMGSLCKLNKLELKLQVAMPALAGQIDHEAESIFKATQGHMLRSWGILLGFVIVCMIASRILLSHVAKDKR